MPISFLLTSYVAVQSKFEWQKSIATGEFIFSANDIKLNNVRAFTIGNAIVFKSRFIDDKYTMAHEMIHVYQYYDYNFVNSYSSNIFKDYSFYKKTNNIIYYDLQAPVLRVLYNLQRGGLYYDNFYEREAGVFSSTYVGNH
jgi:hypothetical protein